MTKIQTFINYLHVRFQIIPLIVLLFTDLIVIKRITNDYIIPDWKLYTCFLFTLIYLFHNRVADDKRDFDFSLTPTLSEILIVRDGILQIFPFTTICS